MDTLVTETQDKKYVLEVVKQFTFSAAHQLTYLPSSHPCSRLHGHTFTVEVKVKGPMNLQERWVMDFSDISAVVKPIIDNHLDHYSLNDIPELKNQPTSEALAIWLWDKIRPQIPLLSEIVVHESSSSRCSFKGEES